VAAGRWQSGRVNTTAAPMHSYAQIRRAQERAEEASGIICVAIVGGAIVPLIYGHVADILTRQFALLVPALCYAVIAGFGIFARRPAVA